MTALTDATDPALEAFMEYFRRNYPGPDTIIGRPDWHSPKIFRAAVRAMKQSGDLIPRQQHLAEVGAVLAEAAKVLDTAGDSAVTEALSQQLCCSGHHCGCQGADVGSFLQHLILAINPDATAALARAVEAGRQVKPLVWYPEPDRDADYPAWSAQTEFGKRYRVFKAWWGAEDKWGFIGDDEFHHTEEAAKAAAQDDYATRIRAALVEVGQ